MVDDTADRNYGGKKKTRDGERSENDGSGVPPRVQDGPRGVVGDKSSAHAQRHKNCPYHVMYDNIQLIAKVFIMNLRDEAFPDMQLFTTKSGLALSHAASVRAIRAVAVKAGIPTTRTIDTSVHENLGEHTPRVSGAQFSQQYCLGNCTSYSCMGGGARWQ